ncbi:peptidylprolyl isomerase [Elongatibacter sediminis]|uniref:Peptidylprolyl isomerase n=1 Tax=Elongatibacter sediminis TaxID=3119006 RepID=A0AAW9RHJ0_9GAMM
MRFKRWLSEPLVHFLLLGGLIFMAWEYLGDEPAGGEIVVSRGQQENLVQTFERTWKRPPTGEEFQGLLDDYVRQEIAYREGTAMGLDEDDIVIRRRLRQKLELLAADVAGLDAPTEEQLQTYLETHPDDFRLAPRLSFRHVFFSRDQRGDATEQDALTLLQRIGTDGPQGDFENQGDPLPLPFRLEDVREGEIERLFGKVFAAGLQGIPVGQWSGPVRSGYGMHLVFIEDRSQGRVPALDDIREAVQREWLSARRRDAVSGLYDRLAAQYTIRVEPVDGPAATAPSEGGAESSDAGRP